MKFNQHTVINTTQFQCLAGLPGVATARQTRGLAQIGRAAGQGPRQGVQEAAGGGQAQVRGARARAEEAVVGVEGEGKAGGAAPEGGRDGRAGRHEAVQDHGGLE